VKKAAPTLAVNSDDEDDFFLPETTPVQVTQGRGRSSFEDGGGSNGGDDLFLDLDKSDDELPTTRTKKRKKKQKRKKKTATAPPPEKKSQEDLDTIAELDRCCRKVRLSTGTRRCERTCSFELPKSATLRPRKCCWRNPESAFFWNCPSWVLGTQWHQRFTWQLFTVTATLHAFC
jgi:hypothetical protein